MRLPEDDEKLFWQELAVLEEEKKMRYVTSVERISQQKGRTEILARMMTKNYGFDNEKSIALLQNLDSDYNIGCSVQIWISAALVRKRFPRRSMGTMGM